MDAILETFLWQCPEDDGVDGEPSPELISKLEADWEQFQAHAEWIPGFNPEDALIERRPWSVEDQMAHDFILTRNHHGAGFWDGDWREPYGAALTQLAHRFGELNSYVGDDGLVYFY